MNLKRIIPVVITIMVCIFWTNVAFAVPMRAEYTELTPVIKFINFLINVIRWGSASVAGLIFTLLGWQMVMNVSTDAATIAKKGIKNVAWGMFFIFCGSFVVDFFVSKFFQIIAGG